MSDQSSLETHDKVYNLLLVHSYSMFCLFMGTMQSAIQVSTEPEVEIEQLKIRTAYFFSKVLFLIDPQSTLDKSGYKIIIGGSLFLACAAYAFGGC